MRDGEHLFHRLRSNHLSYTWLINALSDRGLTVDKSTMSSVVNGTINGPRAEKILEASHAVLDEYDTAFRDAIRS